MRRQIATASCLAVLGAWAVLESTAFSSRAVAQQQTAQAWLDVWRAHKGASQAVPTMPVIPVAASGDAADDGLVHSTIKDIMESIVDPSADALWEAVGTVVDKEGIHESFPKTPEDWRDVRRAAVRIIEGSNLLMMPGREAAPPGTKSDAPGVELEPDQISVLLKKDRAAFDGFAKALQALGAEALQASAAQNAPLLMDIGARMENVCESCHQTYWYPLEKHAAP
jgi:hypothetical protein